MYFITFHTDDETAEEVRNWLKFNPDDGAVALEDVQELCKEFRVNATLRDQNGFLKGSVSKDGSYQLRE